MGVGIAAYGLVKRFPVGGFLGRRGYVEALKGVSFTVERGSVYALLGPNGAGKTTTVRILATLLEPDSGRALVAGFDVVRERREVRRRIGVMLSVERGFFWKLTARENLKYFGMLYGLEGSELDRRVDEVLEIVGLKSMGAVDRLFEDMSLGMRARLGLARALLKDPEVLILDEPTLGLDPPSARYVRGLLRRLARDGRTVLITTHNMYEAENISDRVGIIVGGRIVVEGPPSELKSKVSRATPVVVRLLAPGEHSLKRFREHLRAIGVKAVISLEGGEARLRIQAEPGEEERLVAVIADKARELGLRLVEARIERPSLEDVFMAVAGGDGG